MLDDRTMDPFETVIAELFGDAVDPREAWDLISKANDASEMHVPEAPKPKKTAEQKAATKKKIVNATGQSLNGLAMAAGTHALLMAGREDALREAGAAHKATGKKSFVRAVSAPYRAWESVGDKPKSELGRVGRALKPVYNKIGRKSPGPIKYAVPLAVGALGLHSAELVGDSIAARALHDQRKEIKKALGDIVDARRRGIISTDTAIDMADRLVSKVSTPDSDDIHRAAEAIAPMIPSKKFQMARQGYEAAKPTLDAGTKATKGAVAIGRKGVKLARKPKAEPVTPVEGLPEEGRPIVAKADGPMITWQGEIAKMDSAKRQVFGFAMVTHIDGEPVIDRQGDFTPLEEIEKAAYTYVIESRKGGDMHARDGDKPLHTSDLVESFVITPEKLQQMGLEENALPHGWWVGFKVNDDKQWQDVVEKRRTGFSIHGSGRRVEKML